MKGPMPLRRTLHLCRSKMLNTQMRRQTVWLMLHGLVAYSTYGIAGIGRPAGIGPPAPSAPPAPSGQPAPVMPSVSEETIAMHDLWLAAKSGSPELVDLLLKRLHLPADTVLPETGLTLLLSVANVNAHSSERDEGLKDVMALLLDHGADIAQQVPGRGRDPVAGSTALHLVFKQRGSNIWRGTYLMNRIKKRDGTEALLRVPDCEGHLPEDVADWRAHADELNMLRLITEVEQRKPY